MTETLAILFAVPMLTAVVYVALAVAGEIRKEW